MTQHIPDLLLEQLLCGDLPAAEHDALAQRVAQDPDASQRLEALRADSARLLSRYPASVQAAQISAQLHKNKKQTHRNKLALLAAPLAAALVAVLLLPTDTKTPQDGPDAPDTTRVKGLQPGLRIFKKGAGEPARLDAEATARAGDVLQIGWRAQPGQHVAVLSLDGRGQITRHWPRDADVTAPAPQADGMTPDAYQLDDAPDLERFFLVTSPQPIKLSDLEAALRALPTPRAALTLPSPQNQHDLIVRKDR
jgi:hypothetical protein